MPSEYTYSVVVPSYDEVDTIEDCLESLIIAAERVIEVEILVVDGQSDDGTRELVKEYASGYSFISLHTEHKGNTAAALNVGFDQSSNEVVVMVGSHSTVPPSFFVAIERTFREVAPDADVCGGVMVPKPRTTFERQVSAALRSPLGSSSSRFRPVNGYVDTVNFGAYHRYVIEAVGHVDSNLSRAEDYEYNVRVRSHGYQIYQNTDIKVHYYPRSTVRDLASQYYGNGFWKPHARAKHDSRFQRLARTSQMLRSAGFGCLTLVGLWIALWSFPLVSLPVFGYLATVLSVAAMTTRKMNSVTYNNILIISVLLAIIHASFGIGFCHGLLSISE